MFKNKHEEKSEEGETKTTTKSALQELKQYENIDKIVKQVEEKSGKIEPKKYYDYTTDEWKVLISKLPLVMGQLD